VGGVATTNDLDTGDTSPVDPCTLKILEENIGRETVTRLVSLFHEATLARIVLLREACTAEDHAALRRIAHDWVSDSASLGALALSDSARHVEKLAIAGEAGAFETARNLETMARAASAALAQHVSQAP